MNIPHVSPQHGALETMPENFDCQICHDTHNVFQHEEAIQLHLTNKHNGMTLKDYYLDFVKGKPERSGNEMAGGDYPEEYESEDEASVSSRSGH